MTPSDLYARCAELGRARLERIARFNLNGRDESDPWPEPPSYPFVPSQYWLSTIELNVADHAAEVGFWIDLLGFSMGAFWDDALMVRSPDNTFGLSLYPAGEDRPPVQGVRIELMIDNLVEAAQALKERGVIDDAPFGEPWGAENVMRTCVLTSPSGIRVSLLGQVALAAGEEGGNGGEIETA